MLILSVPVGESVAIGGPVTITVEKKAGQEVKLRFDADPAVPITRVKAAAGTRDKRPDERATEPPQQRAGP
jgi:sRNA-binding carbon storage regulator CsrA